jgi:predicted TIM-barrel fold metal-dependent hydrolase
VHIWAPNTPERPWADPGHGADHRFTALSAAELISLMDDAGVAQAVLIPPAFEGDRHDVVLNAARRWPDRFTAVLRVSLRDTAAGRDLLRSWTAVEGLRGVRVTFTREKRGWLLDGTADWFWEEAEAAGVPVMAYAPGATAQLARIAAEHEGLLLAIDHFGLEGALDEAALDAAARDLERVAARPNLVVKASALPLHVDEPYPFASLHHPLRRVVAAFGPERVFWGSDLSRHGPSYGQEVAWITEVDGLDAAELAWIRGRAVRRWLGMSPPRDADP